MRFNPQPREVNPVSFPAVERVNMAHVVGVVEKLRALPMKDPKKVGVVGELLDDRGPIPFAAFGAPASSLLEWGPGAFIDALGRVEGREWTGRDGNRRLACQFLIREVQRVREVRR